MLKKDITIVTLRLDSIWAVKDLLVEKNIITVDEIVAKVLQYNDITDEEYNKILEGGRGK